MPAVYGNQNAAKDKDWASAIRRALARAEDDPARAAEGDLSAIALLGDRLDGKPHQSIGTDPSQAPLRIEVTATENRL